MIPPDEQKIPAIVLSWDRSRAMVQHMILQYEKLWPNHPFVFHIPYQNLGGTETEKTKYIQAPESIRGTILKLLEKMDDRQWIYWCMDDKYPIRLEVEKIERLMAHALQSAKMSGLLFCRCRQLLRRPKQTLYRGKWRNPDGDIYYQRRGWPQIFIHQLMRAKVLRHLYSNLPDYGQRDHDKLKHEIPMLPDYPLFVTKQNFAIFGESTRRGALTQNCWESIIQTDIELPEWFRQPMGDTVIMGEL